MFVGYPKSALLEHFEQAQGRAMFRNAHLAVGLLAILGALVPVAIATNDCRTVREPDRSSENPCSGSGVAQGCSSYIACPTSDMCIGVPTGYFFCKFFAEVVLPCRVLTGGTVDPLRPGCCTGGMYSGDSGSVSIILLTGGGGSCPKAMPPGPIS